MKIHELLDFVSTHHGWWMLMNVDTHRIELHHSPTVTQFELQRTKNPTNQGSPKLGMYIPWLKLTIPQPTREELVQLFTVRMKSPLGAPSMFGSPGKNSFCVEDGRPRVPVLLIYVPQPIRLPDSEATNLQANTVEAGHDFSTCWPWWSLVEGKDLEQDEK